MSNNYGNRSVKLHNIPRGANKGTGTVITAGTSKYYAGTKIMEQGWDTIGFTGHHILLGTLDPVVIRLELRPSSSSQDPLTPVHTTSYSPAKVNC